MILISVVRWQPCTEIPGHDWTLETLAGVAGQSRSIFAERFSAILGEGAARYLARLRMQLARELLSQNMSVAAVASATGL